MTAAGRVSVIVPVHNESGQLEEFFRRFWEGLGEERRSIVEVLLVENGSTDRTYEACRRLAAEYPGIVLAERVSEASYGGAVKRGIEVSRGDIVCILECDFMDIRFLRQAADIIRAGEADFVVGSKRAEGAEDRRPLLRRLLTAAFNFGLKLLFRFPGTDTHGLKAVRGEPAKRLILLSRTGGEAFQTELVLLAHRLGFRVREVPVNVRELRPKRISILRRLPLLARALRELRASLRRFPELGRPGKGWPVIFRQIFSERCILAVFLGLTLLFQAAVLTKAPFFTLAAGAVFFILVILSLGGLVRLMARRKILVAVLLFIILLRIPFFLIPRGLITNSDNATEYLQCQEMKKTRAMPVFLLEAIRHGGTFRYMCVSFLWGLSGNRLLLYTLVQLAFFLALLYLFARLLEPLSEKPALLFLVFFHFAFIELAFDYSLSLRGGPYLEMLVFILLGLNLFDLHQARPRRTLAAFYFLGFAVYLHPLAALFVLSFLPVVILRSAAVRKFWRTMVPAVIGLLAGMANWLWYLVRIERHVILEDGWKSLYAARLQELTWSHLKSVVESLGRIFTNLFQNDFAFGQQCVSGKSGVKLLSAVNLAVIIFSLAVLLAGLVMAVSRVVHQLRKKEPPDARDWWAVFFLFLLAGFLAKSSVVAEPLFEPRHNFELFFLVILSYPLIFSAVWQRSSQSVRRVGAVVLALFFLASILPHGWYYLKNAQIKERDYTRLVALLKEQKVRYLTTDFSWAYTIYFLSGRTVKVSTTLGPMNYYVFYFPMSEEVDNVPRRDKAFLFFAEDGFVSEKHKAFAHNRKALLLYNLRESGVAYKEFLLESCILVVSQPGKS